jgi:hypothetical protein
MPGLGGVGLALLEGSYAISRFEPGDEVPAWAEAGDGRVLSVTRTAEELSVVCSEDLVPADVDASRGWGALRVRSRLDHSLTGVLASIATPLAAAEVPIFTVSTFDTDYVLFPCQRLEEAVEALEHAGHTFH